MTLSRALTRTGEISQVKFSGVVADFLDEACPRLPSERTKEGRVCEEPFRHSVQPTLPE